MTRSKGRRSRLPVFIASGFATTAVLAALILWVDWAAVRGVLRAVDPILLTGAVASALVLFALRALRLRELLPPVDPERQSALRYLRTTLLHQAVFVLAPSGSGDVVFPPIARLQLGLPWRDAAAALFVARSLDLVALIAAVLVAASAFWIGNLAGWLVGGAVAGLLLPAFRLSGQGGQWVARKLLERRKGARVAARRAAPSMMAMAATIASWCAACAMMGFVLAALARPPGIAGAALLLVALNLSGALAVFTFAGIGFSDMGFAGALLVLGLDGGEAITLALAARMLLLALGAGLPLALDLLLAGATGLRPRALPRAPKRES